MSRPERWTKISGLTREGKRRAELALPHFLSGVAALDNDPGLAALVLREALFRLTELPKRTEEYRRLYEAVNR